VNEHAADAGDVLKHLLLAQVLHLERGRIAVYMDTHAGRPWNDLTQPYPGSVGVARELLSGDAALEWFAANKIAPIAMLSPVWGFMADQVWLR